MAKQFHNLAGWVRDITAARRLRETGDGDAISLWVEFVNNVEYALEEIEGPRLPDDAEDGDADAEDELGEQLPLISTDDVAKPRRHDASSSHRSAPASVLDALLDRLAGPERAAAVAEIDALRRDALAGAQSGTRLSAVPLMAEKGPPNGSKS